MINWIYPEDKIKYVQGIVIFFSSFDASRNQLKDLMLLYLTMFIKFEWQEGIRRQDRKFE
jgi:hypothetical protein